MNIGDEPGAKRKDGKIPPEFFQKRDELLVKVAGLQTKTDNAVNSGNFDPAEYHLDELVRDLGILKNDYKRLGVKADPTARIESIPVPPELRTIKKDEVLNVSLFQSKLNFAVASGNFEPVESSLGEARRKLAELKFKK